MNLEVVLLNLIATLKGNGVITAAQADVFHITDATQLDAERLAKKAAEVAVISPDAVNAIVAQAVKQALAEQAAINAATQVAAPAKAGPSQPIVS